MKIVRKQQYILQKENRIGIMQWVFYSYIVQIIIIPVLL